MPEVLGIDHIYIAVADLAASERFYGVALSVLGFRKNEFVIGGERHVQYYNRHFGYVLRPARMRRSHDAYAPGLHHLCFRVDSRADVEAAAAEIGKAGLAVTEVAHYPQYAPDYFACFIDDPDGLRLEITNYRLERRQRNEQW